MDPESTQLQQAQLAAIRGPDPAPFETLISHLMSSSNEQRSQAELIFNLCKQTDPNSLALKLGHVLQYSPDIEARAVSAILLRKQLTRDDSCMWPRLSPSTQSSLKSILLACVQREEAKTIIKKLCDTVSELASGISPENGWPELLPFMFQCVSSDSPKLQESAFLIFAQLSQCIGDTLLPHLKHLHTVFLQCLTSSSNSDVRIAALSAVINFVQCLSSSSDRDRFQDLLPAMMRTLTEALNCGQEATAQEALELLIELAGTEPRFQLVDVVGSMLQIAEAESLEEGTRHLAIEFVITLAEARERPPGMMRELPQFISKLFAILMKMLLDIEDGPAWHTAETEDEDAGETSNYSVGQECLGRLSIALGGNTIVPVASGQLPAYLAAPEWQKHHAALIALAQIAEGCSGVMITNLEHVVNMVLNSFQDPNPHPRVKWAAINAIGQLSTVLGRHLQIKYHGRVLLELATAMDDFQNPRAQAHAASALSNFIENCPQDILRPSLDGILGRLLVLLQSGNQMVRQGALTALESVARSPEAHAATALSNFIENCPEDILKPRLGGILVRLLDILESGNQMVRQGILTILASIARSPEAHAASALSNFIETFPQDILMPYLGVILDRLLVLLQSGNQMVRQGALTALESVARSPEAHAASALSNFIENCPQDILMPYLGGILERLLVLLQSGYLMVPEGALTVLASVARSPQVHLRRHYDAVMDELRIILRDATYNSNRMLHDKASECMGIIVVYQNIKF